MREEWDIDVLCPADGEKMVSQKIKGVTIDICPKCESIWLDGGEIEALLGPDFSEHLSPAQIARTHTGLWSEADFLTPLVEALLSALLHR